MLQLWRVLKLKEKVLSNRQINKLLNLSHKTVNEYVNRQNCYLTLYQLQQTIPATIFESDSGI